MTGTPRPSLVVKVPPSFRLYSIVTFYQLSPPIKLRPSEEAALLSIGTAEEPVSTTFIAPSDNFSIHLGNYSSFKLISRSWSTHSWSIGKHSRSDWGTWKANGEESAILTIG